MARTSHPRALIFSLLAIVAVVAATGTASLDRPRAALAAPTLFEMYLDCDPAAGVQTTCTFPSGTASVDLDVILKNTSGAAGTVTAFNFDVVTDQQLIFNPKPQTGDSNNSNPDFNESAFSLSTVTCSLPPPQRDIDPSPTRAQSRLVCFTGAGNGPTVADGASIKLATVRYTSVDGSGSFAFNEVAINDNGYFEILSCNPTISVPGNCFGANVTILPPPTATNTPTVTQTPTVTSTPTLTPTPSVPDTDGDGLNDQQEVLIGTNPLNPDTDGDGLTDGQEVLVHFTNPLNPDTDADGLTDGYEVNTSLTNPRVSDTDGDGLSDGNEVHISNTNPLNADTDGDGINDGPEVNTFFTNPNRADSDSDGLTDLQEILIGTNPNNPDTDGDTLTDGQEVLTYTTSPLLRDTDGDLLSDATEVNVTLTNPKVADTDADGLSDSYEVNTSTTNPTNPDTDGDGVSDGAEVNIYHSNPKNVDTDGDTMHDGFEVINSCLNVLVADGAADPDLDFVGNLGELAQGTLPCNPDTDGDGFRDKTATSQAHNNAVPGEDNCILIPNPTQLNSDGDFIDLPPVFSFDDLTNPKSDAIGDPCDTDRDNDGIPDSVELAGPPCASATGPTDPLNADTDGDRVTDGAECAFGTNPNDALSFPPKAPSNDADHDGLDAFAEALLGTNPNNSDTDGDGVNDGVEVKAYGTNPLVADTDGDGCGDGKEVASVNGDRVVNSADLAIVAGHIGPATSPAYLVQFDANKDGAITAGDLAIMAARFGPC